jgi:CRP/FNR family cyclic AMP-dependent transcriptional regulator
MSAPPLPASTDFDRSDRLPIELLDSLARCGSNRSYPAQAILIHEGDDSSGTIYIVLAGRLKVYSAADNGRVIVLAELGPGDYMGELSLDGAKRSVSVQAMEPTRCCVVRGDDLKQFIAEHPAFAWHLTTKLMRMVRRLTEQVKSLALQDVYGRIARLLTESSELKQGQRVVRRRLTQQDIADRVGSSREMVNRVMKELTRGGYVAVDEAHHLVIRRTLPPAW